MKNKNNKSFTDFVSNAVEDSTSSNNSSFEDIFKNSDVLFPLNNKYEDIHKNSQDLFSVASQEENQEEVEENKDSEVKDLFSVASQEENQEEVEENKDSEVKDLFSVASQEENQEEIEENKESEVKDLFSVASQEENQEEVEENKDSEVKDLFSVASQEENQEEVEENKDSEVKDLFSVASQEENQEEIEENKESEVKDLFSVASQEENQEEVEENKDSEVKDLFSVASQEENQEEIEENKESEVKDLFSVASQEENQEEVEENKDSEEKDLFSVASQEGNQEGVEENKESEVKDLFSVASQEENQEEVEENKDSEVKDLFSVASQEENQEKVEENVNNDDKSILPDEVLNTVDDVAAVGGNNLFFDMNQEEDTVQDIDHLVQQNQPQESILTNDSLVQEVESSPVVSDNPFFSNDSSNISQDSDSNPLFLNTLNLVENVVQDKAVSGIDVTKSKNYNVKIVKKKEPLFKVIIGIISYAIFIWLLLVGIVLVIYVLDMKIRQSKGDYSAPTYNAYVVLTGSMLPEIQVYDVVVTKKVDVSSLKVGDVITFASADTRFLGTIITHRILKKNYDAEKKIYTFQTKGDNNNVADSALVPQSNIYGKVIVKIPKLGYLQEFLAADGGWIIVILIPCLAVISYDIVKLAKGLKRKKYKNIKVQK